MNGSAPSVGLDAAMTVAWHGEDGASGGPCYTVDDHAIGSGRAGFDAVLALLRAHPVARVTFVLPAYGLGGQDLIETTPFADRADELAEALGERALGWRAGG
jgi:hypothetical protein